MEIRNSEDCFRLRLLRRIEKNIEKTKKSLEIAKDRLKQAEIALKLKIFRYVILESYMSMFHASRALLYKDGVQEKSHYCIFLYLKDNYSNKIPVNILNFLNIHREERHETMYGIDYEPNEDDAKRALEDAKIFLNEIIKVN